MKTLFQYVFLMIVTLVSIHAIKAQEWQWSVAIQGTDQNARAFLWIPPNCKYIRGVVMAQHNMEEISILENPIFRNEMTKLGFAEVWVSPSPSVLKFYDFTKGAAEITASYIDSLANISGYSELKVVPVVGIGHSAAASWPYYYGAYNPQKTLACISVSGQWPYYRDNKFAPDIWKPEHTIDYIPCLETMGEYEAAATWSVKGLKDKKNHPLLPLSMLAAPGEGHFASSDKKAAFIAFYIKKAIQYRYPKSVKEGTPIPLTPIDPTKTGWLAPKWHSNQAPTTAPASVANYTGNKDEAFWYFDEATANEVVKYGAAFRGLKPQLVGFVQDGQMEPQKNTHLQVTMPFKPLADGLSFCLKGRFYDTVPAISNRLANWTGLPVGSSLDHAANTDAICIERICGPFKKINDTLFQLAFDRSINLKSNKLSLTLAVKHPGNSQFKSVVQQGEIVLPALLKEGTPQNIQFPEIPTVKQGHAPITLSAISDAGLPVQYFVLDGPAQITNGNKVVFTKIPTRSKFPIKVTIIAWQYGLSGTQKIQSAFPINQTFYITEK